jgi:hypothetical protein
MITSSEKDSSPKVDQQGIQMTERLNTETPLYDSPDSYRPNSQLQLNLASEGDQFSPFPNYKTNLATLEKETLITEPEASEGVFLKGKSLIEQENFKGNRYSSNTFHPVNDDKPNKGQMPILTENEAEKSFDYMRVKTTEGNQPEEEPNEHHRAPLGQHETVKINNPKIIV